MGYAPATLVAWVFTQPWRRSNARPWIRPQDWMCAMAGELSADTFSSFPLKRQIETLEAGLKDQDPRELLELCGAVRDHAPLAWLG